MDKNKYFKLLTCIFSVLFAVSVVSCEKDSDSENTEPGTSGETSGSGVTSECVLGYGMPTNYDIIPDAAMSGLINDMISLASDIGNAQFLRSQGLSVSSRDMDSYLGKLWVQSGSFDCDMSFSCFRIKSANTLEKYDVRATTSRPSNSDFVITNNMDWFSVCDGTENKYMQAQLGGVSVYFYKTNKKTKTVKYNISPLDNGKGYYIYANDAYGNSLAYFEWWNFGHWYCEPYYINWRY